MLGGNLDGYTDKHALCYECMHGGGGGFGVRNAVAERI